jgi:SAM-dependent methyltransferase
MSGMPAAVYDLQYDAKNYEGEATWIAEVVRRHAPRTGSLLDVCCGTGKHLLHLNPHFPTVAGLDLSRAQLAGARELLPDEVALHYGDMCTFQLARKFGAVTCLFSSLSYLLTREQLVQAMRTMVRHVEPGGLTLLQRGLTPDEFSLGAGTTRTTVFDAPGGGSLVRMSVLGSMPIGGEGRADVTIYYIYSSTTSDGIRTVDIYTDDDPVGLFTEDSYAAALREAGAVDVWTEEPPEYVGPYGKPLLVGRVAS